MKSSLQGSFTIALQNNAHSHVYPAVTSLRQSYCSNREFKENQKIDQYIRLKSRQEMRTEPEFDAAVELNLAVTGGQIPQTLDTSYRPDTSSDHRQAYQVYNDIVQENVSDNQSSSRDLQEHEESFDSLSNSNRQRAHKSRKKAKTRDNEGNVYDKPKSVSNRGKKHRDVNKSQGTSLNTVYDSKNNAVFPCAYISNKLSSQGSKSRKRKVAKGLPYTEALSAPKLVCQKPKKTNTQLNLTMGFGRINAAAITIQTKSNSAGMNAAHRQQKDSSNQLNHEGKEQQLYAVYQSKKSEHQTQNLNSMNVTKAYFCNEKLEQSPVSKVNQTQQHFHSNVSAHPKNNLITGRKQSQESLKQVAVDPVPQKPIFNKTLEDSDQKKANQQSFNNTYNYSPQPKSTKKANMVGRVGSECSEKREIKSSQRLFPFAQAISQVESVNAESSLPLIKQLQTSAELSSQMQMIKSMSSRTFARCVHNSETLPKIESRKGLIDQPQEVSEAIADKVGVRSPGKAMHNLISGSNKRGSLPIENKGTTQRAKMSARVWNLREQAGNGIAQIQVQTSEGPRVAKDIVIADEGGCAADQLSQSKAQVTPRRHTHLAPLEYQTNVVKGSPGNSPDEKTTSQVRSRDQSLVGSNAIVRNQMAAVRDDKSPTRLLMGTPTAQPRIINKLKDSVIYCQATFAEPFYRRAMFKLGWQLVPVQTRDLKPKFHIKFDVDDLQGTATDLRGNQFYNHFPSNRECVTKSGLCKNLWFNNTSEGSTRVSQFFPRCYDLSEQKQSLEFTQDFVQTAVLSILKMVADRFVQANPDILTLVDEHRRQIEFATPRVFKQQLKQRCNLLDEQKYPEGGLISSDELRLCYAFCKELLNRIRMKETKGARRNSKLVVQEASLPLLLAFQARLVDQGVGWEKADTYEQLKVVKLSQDLAAVLNQFREIDGVSNVWIVKPSYNSRGFGIYCTRQLSQINPDNKKTQQKVVQKYIERPFCINDNKKFDLRQWVLVNSWEPLDVCVFSSAYLKICAQPYDLTRLEDVNRHLSNYTLNKKEVEDQEEIVMSIDQFEEQMRERAPKSDVIPRDFAWSVHLLPKIKDIVWRSLKSIQETQEQRNNCFEVFGFDIVLDEGLNPWLIEINLSPACSERTPWLTQMLDESSLDLLTYVQNKILIANPGETWSAELLKARKAALGEQTELKLSPNLNNEAFYDLHKPKDRWIRLDESIREIKALSRCVPHNEQKVELAVAGQKCDLKYERKLIRSFRQEQAVCLMQRFWRGVRGRRSFRHTLETKHAIVIQRHARMFLAKLLCRFIRKTNAATFVQRFLRRKLAQNYLERLRQEHILALKTDLVLKLQCLFRRRVAIAQKVALREQRAATILQRTLRGFRSRQYALRLRDRRRKIILIQRYYKQRFCQRKSSSIVIQKYMRGLIGHRRSVNRKRVQSGGALLLQTWSKHMKRAAVRSLVQHASALVIQAHLRRVLARRRCLRELQSIARTRLRRIARKYVFQQVKRLSEQLRREREAMATLVQRYVRGRLSMNRVIQRKQQIKECNAAILVQRILRGYLAVLEAGNRRLQIGAAIMIQAVWRGVLGRRRFQRILEKRQRQAQRELLREKRLAEKQAKEDYDPSNDNLMQIFGVIKPQSKQQKQQKVKETKLAKKSSEKKRFQSKESSRNITQRKNLQSEVFAAAMEMSKRRKQKKSVIKEKLYKLQADQTRRSIQKQENGGSDQSEASSRDKLRSPTNHSSQAPDHEELAHQQSIAALKLQVQCNTGQLSQRTSQLNNQTMGRNEAVTIIKKSVERSADFGAKGKGVAKTVVIKKDPSRDKIPVWAQNAIKACESPKLIEKQPGEGFNKRQSNDYQVLERVVQNGSVKYKVFSMQTKTSLDRSSTNKVIFPDPLDGQQRPQNQDKVKRSTLFRQSDARGGSQTSKQPKSFAENLLERLEHQTKDQREKSINNNQQNPWLDRTKRSELLDKTYSSVDQQSEAGGKKSKHKAIFGVECRRQILPTKLSPGNANVLSKRLPPVEVFTPMQLAEGMRKQQLDPIDYQALSKEALLQTTLEQRKVSQASRKSRLANEDEVQGINSSKALISDQSHKSEFATNYDAFKSNGLAKQQSKFASLVKSSEVLGDIKPTLLTDAHDYVKSNR